MHIFLIKEIIFALNKNSLKKLKELQVNKIYFY